MSVHSSHAARIHRLRAVLEEVIALAEDLPSGVETEADPQDERPEDMAAHIGGLIVRRCREALEKECSE